MNLYNKLKSNYIKYNSSIYSVGILFFGTFLGSLFAFLIQVILARKLGSTSYGMFSAILAMIIVSIPITLLGIPQLWLRIYAQEGYYAKRWLNSSFKFISISTILVIFIINSWAIVNNDNLTAYTIFILSLYILGQIMIELVSSKLQIEGRYLYLAVWQFLPHFLRILSVFILVYLDIISVKNVAYTYAIVSIIMFLSGFIHLLDLKNGKIILSNINNINYNDKISIVKLIKETLPFGLAGFFYLIYFQSDIYIIKYILNDNLAGIYNVAFILMIAIYMFPNVLYQKFLLPKLHIWSHNNSKKFYTTYINGNKIMFLLGLFTMFIVWLLSDYLILIIFGEEYRNSIIILNILALSIPVSFVSFSMGAILTTKEFIKVKVKCMGITALLNIILNIILIPNIGIIGAAIATVASNFLLFISFYISIKKYVFHDLEYI